MPTRITEQTLRALGPGKTLRDTELKGLVAKKSHDGATVAVSIRRQGARPVHRVLGHMPPAKWAEIKDAARKALAAHELNDPAVPRSKWNLDKAWTAYKAQLQTRKGSAGTIRAYQFALDRLDLTLRKKSLTDLAPEDMTTEFARLLTASGPSAAHASGVLVRILWNYIVRRHDRRLVPQLHPCVDLNLGKLDPVKGAQPMTPEQLRPWWLLVRKHESPLRQQAILFTLLSGLRIGDVCTMAWPNLVVGDLPVPYFKIPRPKGGGRKAFDLLISGPMNECLDRALALAAEYEAKRESEKELHWVWPGAGRDGHLTDLDHQKTITKFANHDLRASYASLGRLAGVTDDLISRLMNHGSTGNAVTAGYIRNRPIAGLLIESQECISSYLMNAIGGQDPHQDATGEYAEYIKDAD